MQRMNLAGTWPLAMDTKRAPRPQKANVLLDHRKLGSDSTFSSCDSDASIVVPVVYDSSTVSPSTDVSEGNRARRARARKFRKK